MAMAIILGALLAAVPALAGWGDFLKDLKLPAAGSGSSLSDGDIVSGLKEALSVGADRAVTTVSKSGGYFDNPEIRIPLPGSVEKAEGILRAVGYGPEIDAFESSMNRAAEKAAPEAKPLFMDAVKEMTFADERQILNGGDNAATLYFKEKTSGRLTEIFKPLVHDSMTQVGVTRQYQAIEAKANTLPFAGSLNMDLDQYVTEKALDGLFVMLGKEEALIRQNPVARTTDLLKKVFGP